MRKLYWLKAEALPKMKPYLPVAVGPRRVDDRRVISGIVKPRQS